MATRKDFAKAADIVKGITKAGYAWTVREAFVGFFAGQNPRFDADRFREACGPVAASHKPPSR